MFCTRQGERDMAHSENPVVAGLRDPKTCLSAHDVIERSASRRRVGAAWAVDALAPPLIVLSSLLKCDFDSLIHL